MGTSTVMLFIIQKLLYVSKYFWRTLDVCFKEKIISDASRHFLTAPEFVNLGLLIRLLILILAKIVHHFATYTYFYICRLDLCIQFV